MRVTRFSRIPMRVWVTAGSAFAAGSVVAHWPVWQLKRAIQALPNDPESGVIIGVDVGCIFAGYALMACALVYLLFRETAIRNAEARFESPPPRAGRSRA